MSKSIKLIVLSYLVSNDYDGLCNANAECGCDIHDLMACGGPNDQHCRAAYKLDCSRCKHGPEHEDTCEHNDGEYDYIMSTDKDRCKPEYVEVGA